MRGAHKRMYTVRVELGNSALLILSLTFIFSGCAVLTKRLRQRKGSSDNKQVLFVPVTPALAAAAVPAAASVTATAVAAALTVNVAALAV